MLRARLRQVPHVSPGHKTGLGRAAVVLWLLLTVLPMSLRSQPVPAADESAAVPAGTVVARVAEMRPVHAAFGWFRKHERRLSDWQLELTRIPAPPFAEEKRAAWFRSKMEELGLEQVHTDELGNVFGVRPGSDPDAPYVALSAHLDTVFPAETPLEVRREGDRLLGPGISDNGAGLTALLGIAAALRENKVRHRAPLLFIANVGEEGEGDLRGMRHIFEQRRWRERIGSMVVVDGSGTDTIVAQALGSRRFQVIISGPGGHSWSDYGVANPIVAMARAIERLMRAPIPAEPKTTLNIGIIEGGTSVNSIPERASMRVDIRSTVPEEIARLEQALRDAVKWAVEGEPSRARGRKQPGLDADIRLIGDRPAADLHPEARILQIVRAVDEHLGNAARVQRASTDANVPLALGYQAVSLGAGGSGGGAHSLNEWYDPRGREVGLQRILLTALALAGATGN
jgi:tripeptide aminopeptidase